MELASVDISPRISVFCGHICSASSSDSGSECITQRSSALEYSPDFAKRRTVFSYWPWSRKNSAHDLKSAGSASDGKCSAISRSWSKRRQRKHSSTALAVWPAFW